MVGMVLQLVDAQVGRCDLSAWSGHLDRCRWCDGMVLGTGEWCSAACSDAHHANHEWARAHDMVLARDRDRCVDCGTGPESAAELRWLIRAFIPMDPVQAATLWRSEEWLALQLAASVDVVPRSRSSRYGYHSGCHHHLDELVTVCRGCQEARRTTIDLRAG